MHDEKILMELIKIRDLILSQQSITPRWLTMQQASEYCNKSKNWLRDKLIAGEILGVQAVGKAGHEGNWTIDRVSIDNYFLKDSLLLQEKLSSLKL